MGLASRPAASCPLVRSVTLWAARAHARAPRRSLARSRRQHRASAHSPYLLSKQAVPFKHGRGSIHVVVCVSMDDSAAAAAQVTVDNCTTSSYTVVSVACRDRKGLVYDLFRTLKDIHIRVAYAKARPGRAAAQGEGACCEVGYCMCGRRTLLYFTLPRRWRPGFDRGCSVEPGLAALCWQEPPLCRKSSTRTTWQTSHLPVSWRGHLHGMLGLAAHVPRASAALPPMPALGAPPWPKPILQHFESCVPGAARCAYAATCARRTCLWKKPTGTAPSGAPARPQLPAVPSGAAAAQPPPVHCPGAGAAARGAAHGPPGEAELARLLCTIRMDKTEQCARAPVPH